MDTPKTVLVPVELFEPGTERNILAFGGMSPAEGEMAVASEERNGMVAVMAVAAAEWERLRERLERGEVCVTSPLLDATCGDATDSTVTDGGFLKRERRVTIVLTRENVYIAVHDGGKGGVLAMAEALPDNSTDSILYYMQLVGRRFKLRKFRIVVSGPRATEVADVLRRYYKKAEAL